MENETWWTIGEDDESVYARMTALLRQLYAHAEEAGSEEAGSIVFVGHAQVLCRLFRKHLSPDFAATKLGSGLQAKTFANCAVLKMKLAQEGLEALPIVVHAEFLFESGFTFGQGL